MPCGVRAQVEGVAKDAQHDIMKRAKIVYSREINWAGPVVQPTSVLTL